MKRNCYWEIYHWQGQQANKGALVCESASVSCLVVCYFLRPYGLYPIRLLCPWNSPGKNTGVGSHSLLQGIFLTQGLNLCLLYCRFFTAWATRKAPRILEWWPFPSPGDLPDPGVEPRSPTLQADSLHLSHQESHQEGLCVYIKIKEATQPRTRWKEVHSLSQGNKDLRLFKWKYTTGIRY